MTADHQGTEVASTSSAEREPAGAFSAAAAIDALDAATRAIAGELDLDRVLQLMADSVRHLVQADYGALGIVDAAGRIERFITSGINAADRERIGAPPRGHGLLGLIIREGRSIRVPDIASHPDAYGFPPGHPPMHAFLGVPIRAGGSAIGNFYLTDKVGGALFDERDERLVEMFALHAAIAIQNARLHDRVQRLAVVDERIRIGRDLHDGIIQGIYAVTLSLEDVPELMDEDPAEASARVDRAIDRLTATIGEIRQFIVGLETDVPNTLGARLAGLVDELRLSTGTRFAIELDVAAGLEHDDRLGAAAVDHLVHIAREAIGNAIRHSGATGARLSLRVDGSDADGGAEVTLVVEDDGRGFDPGAEVGPGHYGLRNLRERAGAAGGILTIASRRGAGTRIIVRIPMPGPENHHP